MAKKTVKQIVEEALPDMEIVDTPPQSTPDSVRQATSPGPSMSELRMKYLGPDAEENGEADALAALAESEQDVEVKQLRRKQTPADPADDPGPRAVIISKTGGMIASQG